SEILDELSLYCKEVIGPDRVINMSLNVFLKECISTWKKKFWSIEIIGKSEGTLEVECSKIKLKKALENLILNSMEAGASEVIIEVNKEGLSFIDDGSGITPEDSAEIKNSGTTKGRGRGTGLKMVKGFLKSIDWSLELKNNPEEGLTVNLKKGA
ncbi:MAG: ATP-binding protein, partial [Halobacteriovoraceae bacterium]|nr:ATP-binding protein [Halobacteriovoraceae bacterium]